LGGTNNLRVLPRSCVALTQPFSEVEGMSHSLIRSVYVHIPIGGQPLNQICLRLNTQ
jgi:hypothetical protein